MRILFITSDLSRFGGIQAYNRTLVAMLRAEGEDVRMVELHDTSFKAKLIFTISFFWKSLVWAPAVTLVANINFSPLAYLAGLFIHRPYTVTIYGIEVTPIRSVLQRRALAHALLVIKLFDQAERDVVKQILSLRGSIVAIPNSADGDRFTILPQKPRELLARYGFADALVVLTICRLSSSERDNKGYAKVVGVFPEVLKKVPNARYLLVGGGDDRSAMIALVKDVGLENRVIFPGVATNEEMVSYYNLADVFVYPSKHEGFPAIVLLEALACGTPVIGGRQPDAINSDFDGNLGLIVDPDDRGALAEAIVQVLTRRAPAHFFRREELRRIVLEKYGPVVYREHVRSFLARVRHELSRAA